MNFKYFMEMALKKFRLGPFKDDNLSEPFASQIRTINQADEKSVSHPKTYRQLERVLKTSTQFDFNILVGSPGSDYGYGSNAGIKFVKAMEAKREIVIDGHITFLKMASSGGVLTAWMLLHTMSHAILDAVPESLEKIKRELYQLETGINADKMSRVKNLASVFQFRSARMTIKNPSGKLAVPDVDELIYELMTEYLWHGRIRTVQPNPVVRGIESLLHEVLRSAVGRTFIDN